MIAAVVNVPAYYLMALPEIQSVQDLRGKKVGITRIGASSDFAIRLVLKKAGLVPDKDVALIQVGESSSLAAALSTRAKNAKPEEFIDDQIVRDLEREGYFSGRGKK